MVLFFQVRRREFEEREKNKPKEDTPVKGKPQRDGGKRGPTFDGFSINCHPTY